LEEKGLLEIQGINESQSVERCYQIAQYQNWSAAATHSDYRKKWHKEL
jgi:hypothetical protein